MFEDVCKNTILEVEEEVVVAEELIFVDEGSVEVVGRDFEDGGGSVDEEGVVDD